MFRHILVPTDGSDLSQRAVAMGIGLARACQARLFALHVVEPFQSLAYMTELLAASEFKYNEEAASFARTCLDEVRAAAAEAGVDCDSTYVIDDRPYKAILATTAQRHCDLVVMASHGWRGFNRLLLGSETHKVLLRSEVPVLVCR